MNVIRGRVVLKETGVGIPDLHVVVYDVDPGTKPEEANLSAGIERSASTNTAPPDGDRIGSRLTNKQGEAEFNFEDDEFRIRNPEEKRPDLSILVLAPEEDGVAFESRVLFRSAGVVQNAGRTEEFLLRIPGDRLKAAGIPLPLDASVATEDRDAVATKMRQAVDYRASLDDEVRKIATERVATVRTQAKTTDALVESRLFEFLTGVKSADADKLNVVLPGQSPEPIVWRAANKVIADQVNAGPVAGYVVLSESEAQAFKDAGGHYRTHIPAAEIEPYLFQADSNAKRTSTILRSDPADAICRQGSAPSTIVDGGGTTGTGNGTGDGGGSGPDVPVTAADLPKFVGRLLNPMVAPESSALSMSTGRPTAADVQSSVSALALGGGPADVTAYYDFHQLQIAFPYVWQHAIDDGIIANGQQLVQQLTAAGGDPNAGLQPGVHPVKAWRDEVRYLTTASTSLQAGNVSYRMATGGLGTNPLTPTFPPTPPRPLPPIVRPPFFDGFLGSDSVEPNDLLGELGAMLSERYTFQTFAPGSVNFGLMVTYRQRWDPETYQVGDLVKTLTLAPKETRKVTSKRTVKRERSVKELQDNQRNRKDETSQTMRDEAEIVQRAQTKTSFSLTAKGSYDIGISDGDATSTFARDAEASSQETKKAFHEAVLKAAQEFRDERKLEVESKDAVEIETTDTAEISNPNDELTVTYLFYELQRRYRVSEHIHRLSPMVLVAMEVPNPNRDAIDKVLLAHSWIINRVLLDDRYRAPLDYLCTRVVGDELGLQELANNVSLVRAAVEELKKMHRDMQAEMDAREWALQTAVATRAGKVADNNGEGVAEKALEWVVGGGSSSDTESARLLEDYAREAYDRSVREEKELRMRLDAETSTLSSAQEAYAKARAMHSNQLLQIAGLRVHFKENVLYYMQAIWNFTFKDQIFFSLCNVKVPVLKTVSKTYELAVPTELPLSIAPKPGQVVLEVRADVQLQGNLDPALDFVTLAEVADLDNPMGFKGNYMLFPLKESNALTDYMMMPYVDSELGLHDPDDLGSWTPEDFVRYAKCLQMKLKGELSASDYAALQAQLEAQYKRIVSNPRPLNDEIIVPTTSLYIEALPGAHPLLENFKLEHRAVDVRKAKAEVRKLEMENLRYAARLLGDNLADPEIDKKVVISGLNGGVVVPSDV